MSAVVSSLATARPVERIVRRSQSRIELMGCPIDNLTMAETLDTIEEFIDSGEPHQHVAINVSKLVEARRNPGLKQFIRACDLTNADGMPVVWASRLLGRPLKERVTGVDLFEGIMRRAATKGWRVYLLGARPEVVKRVREVYEGRFPRVKFAGHHCGYWHPDEEDEVVERIARSRADVLFVAISSPMKEKFLARHQPRMRIPFAMGVGGTFDVVAGDVKRAPAWMQKTGLEWLHRSLQEPRRMFPRYLSDALPFLDLFARDWLKR